MQHDSVLDKAKDYWTFSEKTHDQEKFYKSSWGNLGSALAWLTLR